MEIKNKEYIYGYNYIYGKPFSGVYSLVSSKSFEEIFNIKDVNEANRVYRDSIISTPLAEWYGQAVNIDVVNDLLNRKRELLEDVTDDIITMQKDSIFSNFIELLKYLELMGVNLETLQTVDKTNKRIAGSIERVKELMQEEEIRSYLALLEYLKTLHRQIEELLRIHQSLQCAPNKDNSTLNFYDIGENDVRRFIKK